MATEEYEDKDGKLKLRKKYISGDEATRLRNNMYRKKRAEAETDKEKKACPMALIHTFGFFSASQWGVSINR